MRRYLLGYIVERWMMNALVVLRGIAEEEISPQAERVLIEVLRREPESEIVTITDRDDIRAYLKLYTEVLASKNLGPGSPEFRLMQQTAVMVLCAFIERRK